MHRKPTHAHAQVLESTAKGCNDASVQRARAVRRCLHVWGSQHYLTAAELASVVAVLRHESDRVAAMTVLWPRVVDMHGMVQCFATLKTGEQRQVRGAEPSTAQSVIL